MSATNVSRRQCGDLGRRLIRQFESCAKKRSDGKFQAYLCPAGKWTCGWGTTGPDVGPRTVWTQAECDERFAHDVAEVAAEVDAMLGPAVTTQGQFDALVSFAYNLGSEALRHSTLLARHEAKDFAGAEAQFVKWDKAHVGGKLVELEGLKRRREAEADLYGSGS